MTAWLETGGVLLLALLGVVLGRWFSGLRKPFWVLGYLIPLGLVCLIGAARHVSALEMRAPLAWIMAGRTEFALSALLTTMLLTTPLSRLPLPRVRLMVCVLMVAVVVHVGVLPFLGPALNRNHLASLLTQIDDEGICRQSNEYTCGPAAAVTALRRLGFRAEEGEIAILAHTSWFTGTEPDSLCEALQARYGDAGLVCAYRHFRSVDELREQGLTLARIKFGLLVDHWVTVLQVEENGVVVGDPMVGKQTMPRLDFERRWRFCGVVLRGASAL